MIHVAKDIVQALYSNDPSQIQKAFLLYKPDLENLIKLAFEEKNQELKEIQFSSIAFEKIHIEDIRVHDDLCKTVLEKLNQNPISIQLIQPKISYIEIEISAEDTNKAQNLLSCLKGNCWTRDQLQETFGAERYTYDIIAFYCDVTSKTIYRLLPTPQKGSFKSLDYVFPFTSNLKKSLESSELTIDETHLICDSINFFPILYFFCMKAGLSFSSVSALQLHFTDNDPIEIKHSEAISGGWKQIINTTQSINISRHLS